MKIDISQSIQESVETLISDKLVECNSDLLEKAIHQWVEEFIEELPTNIEWHFHNNSRLQKLINKAELKAEEALIS